MMDVLYLYKEFDPNNVELKYSLRSLCNIPHGKVWFAGDLPTGYRFLNHIPTEQTKTKYKNSRMNLVTACKDPNLSDDFIFMNDDFYILKPIKDPAKELNLYRGTLSEIYQRYLAKLGGFSQYSIGMLATKEFLIQNAGIQNPLSYDLHIPFVMNKHKALKMFEMGNYMDIPVIMSRSVYGNLYLKDSVKTEDVKIYGNEPINLMGKFLSSDNSTIKNLLPILNRLFPKKSPYELP